MLKLGDLKPGDRLVAGDGLICLEEGQVVTVIEAEGGGLAITCSRGEHLLKPRATKDGMVLGFTRAPVVQAVGVANPAVVPRAALRSKGRRGHA